MAATEGPVAEFSGFANFEEKKRKPKIVNQMGFFGQKRKKKIRFCRRILDIFGFTLLKHLSRFNFAINL